VSTRDTEKIDVPTDEPLAETMHADLADVAIVPDDPADLDHNLRTEIDLLVALAWAPQQITDAVVEALVGTLTERAGGHATDRIPATSPLFLKATHQLIWEAIVELADIGTPTTPTLIAAHLTSAVRSDGLTRALVELASPTGRPPGGGGHDAPYLAAAVIDQWYERGYRAMAARLSTVVAPRSGTRREEYAQHWADLTIHQQAAAARWTSIHTALAAI
jgi:hypothetical protein